MYAPAIVVTEWYDHYSGIHNKGSVNTYGVPSGPVIYANMNNEGLLEQLTKLTRHLIMSTLVSSTRRNTDESQATGRFVVNTASCTLR